MAIEKLDLDWREEFEATLDRARKEAEKPYSMALLKEVSDEYKEGLSYQTAAIGGILQAGVVALAEIGDALRALREERATE